MASEWVPDIGERVRVGGNFEAVVVSISLEFEIVTILIHDPDRAQPRPHAETFDWARKFWRPLSTNQEGTP